MYSVLLLYGGQSGEHEVSCVSAEFLSENIQKAAYLVYPVYIDKKGIWHLQEKVHKIAKDNRNHPCFLRKNPEGIKLVSDNAVHKVDFAFPIIHGTRGEDGSLQGLFEMIDLPYAGAGVLTSALCMDKSLTRMAFSASKIPQVKYLTIDQHEKDTMNELCEKIQKNIPYPVFIKPCNMGSSVGVSKAENEKELIAGIKEAFKYDDHILAEEGRTVRELEIGILGNYPEYTVTDVGEIAPSHSFYSYDAKYNDPEGARLEIKADIPKVVRDKIRDLAVAAFKAVRGDGFARIDFFLDKETEEVLINEINTLPGFTPISMFPRLWAAAMVNGPMLVGKIITAGLKRAENAKKLER